MPPGSGVFLYFLLVSPLFLASRMHSAKGPISGSWYYGAWIEGDDKNVQLGYHYHFFSQPRISSAQWSLSFSSLSLSRGNVGSMIEVVIKRSVYSVLRQFVKSEEFQEDRLSWRGSIC